jgi:hypothetical protein
MFDDLFSVINKNYEQLPKWKETETQLSLEKKQRKKS